MFKVKSSKTIRTAMGIGVTAAIFWWMLKPIIHRWHDVGDHILHTSSLRFALAAAMFSVFLFVFRAMVWRKILTEFGIKLPIPPATRIWSTSELARYVPGSIMQVIGRVYLARPYGVDGATCSTSQLLELTIFLLANLIAAVACLPWFAARLSGYARLGLFGAAALAPLLMLLLRPRVFYGIMNSVLRKLKKRPIEARVPSRDLMGILLWNLLGLCWQGLAIWLLVGQPEALDLNLSRIGLVIGAYSLAWCAGFLAFWAPGGIGMRELVLVAALRFALPSTIVRHFSDRQSFDGFLAFLAVLLRLWTIAGELLLASIAYLFDMRGALGLPGAIGRMTPPAAAGDVSNPGRAATTS